MNHFLVSVLGYVNGAIAVLIVLAGMYIGGNGAVSGNPNDGAAIGFVLGLGVAAVVCGLLAIAISIEKSLKHIAEKLPWPEGKQ